MSVTSRYGSCLGIVLLAITRCANAADSADPVGFVKVLSGHATIFRAGTASPASLGEKLLATDRIETGLDGAIGISFVDDARVSMGPGSSLDITAYVFDPEKKNYNFAVKLGHGTLQYFSGLIGKLSPQSITITTPSAVVGVRGTHFLARAVSQ